jgi:hypothetical protein
MKDLKDIGAKLMCVFPQLSLVENNLLQNV